MLGIGRDLDLSQVSDKPILYDGDTGGAKEARSSLTLISERFSVDKLMVVKFRVGSSRAKMSLV